MKERKQRNKEEKKIRQALKKEQANIPMKASLFHQGKPLEEILREKGLDEDEIELVENQIEGLVKELEENADDQDQ